uniref:RELT TNF receptor n=1 Tax=Gouania willdenowi TaxID=441366 RepID=A0A8C5HBM6_GOUWI
MSVFYCSTASVQCKQVDGCACPKCPAGQEPSKACSTSQSPVEYVQCRSCPTGSFSETLDSEVCHLHTSCELLGRKIASPGTSTSDVVCGDCITGGFPLSIVLSAASHTRAVRTVRSGPASVAGGSANSSVLLNAEEKAGEYAVFALVPVFCVMGLLGILICNILKKKGYRCSEKEGGGDVETPSPQKESNTCPCITEELNEDTISVLVRLITEKKENAAALEELLLEYENKQMSISKGSSIKFPMLSPLFPFRSLPRPCPHQSHLHTISGLSGLGHKHGYRCTRCSQKKWPPVFIPPLDSLKDPLKPPLSLVLCDALFLLVVDRFQVAQIPEQKSSTLEAKKPSSQEQRSSMFEGKHFYSSSSGTRRYNPINRYCIFIMIY